MAKDMLKAAKSGDAQKVKALLAKDSALVNALDTDGSTPLHCAAWKGHLDVVEVLLMSGADVNAHNQNDHWGTTPLHAAAHANEAKIVQLLLSHGADPRAKDLEGRTPFEHTKVHKANAAAKLLRDG